MTRDEADAAARQIVQDVGTCEACRAAPATDAHEILRGPLRRLARGKRCCTLALCRECHRRMDGMAWERQLLILYRSRKDDMNMREFWKIAGRQKPTPEDLIAEAMKHGAEVTR